MLTKGAIGNLVNRYKAVLKKCNLINTFGSLAVASMLVLGGAGVASAEDCSLNYQSSAMTISSDKSYKNITMKGGELTVDKNAKLEVTSKATLYGNRSNGRYVDIASFTSTGGLELKGVKKFSNTPKEDNATCQVVIDGDVLNVSGAIDNKYSFGIHNTYDYAPEIKFNTLNIENDTGYGLYIQNSNANLEIKNITINSGWHGIWLTDGSSTTNRNVTIDGVETLSVNSSSYLAVRVSHGHNLIINAVDSGANVELKSEANNALHVDHASTSFTLNNKSGSNTITAPDSKNAIYAAGSVIVHGTDNTINGNVEVFSGQGINEASTGSLNLIAENKNTVTGNITVTQEAAIKVSGVKNTLHNDITNDGDMTIEGATTLGGSITGEGILAGKAEFTVTNGSVKIKQKEVTGDFTATATGDVTDALGGDLAQLEENLGGINVTKMEAGKVFGAVDESGKMAKNEIMDAALQQASITMVSLDKILTNDVRKRLGDIRSDANTTGVWMRWDGGKMKGDSGLTNNFNTIQIGGDTKVAKNCRLGVAGSFTHGDMDFNRGGGELEGFSFALYGTWMGENGMFADIVARLGHFSTEMSVEGDNGDVDNRVASLSGEYGWRFNVCDQFFIEPQVELAYTYVSSDDLQLGDAQYKFDNVDSLTGRAGLVAGWTLPDDRGNLYARASVVQQFMGDAKISGSINGKGNIQEIDGDDTWLEYGIGANVKLTDKTYIWADVERTEGADIDEEWRGTVGIRYSF